MRKFRRLTNFRLFPRWLDQVYSLKSVSRHVLPITVASDPGEIQADRDEESDAHCPTRVQSCEIIKVRVGHVACSFVVVRVRIRGKNIDTNPYSGSLQTKHDGCRCAGGERQRFGVNKAERLQLTT